MLGTSLLRALQSKMALNIVNTEVVPLEKGLDLIHRASFSPSESPVYVTSLALRLVNSLLHWDMCINDVMKDLRG